jgi:hypothetical protein
MFKDLIERVKSVFTKPAPVEFAPRLSAEKERAVAAFFEAHAVYLKDPSFDNHIRVYRAHLASKDAK